MAIAKNLSPKNRFNGFDRSQKPVNKQYNYNWSESQQRLFHHRSSMFNDTALGHDFMYPQAKMTQLSTSFFSSDTKIKIDPHAVGIIEILPQRTHFTMNNVRYAMCNNRSN